jgi:hypothetical protein
MKIIGTIWTNVEPGIEVYLILPILGIGIFFFWRWLFRKLIKLKTKRLIIIWVTTIITTPILYAGLILIWILMLEYYPDRVFDKTKWLNDPDKRYELSKSIIERKILIGKSKSDVKAILGDGANTNNDNQWYYNLGYRPQLAGIDPDNLEIDFENGKVVNVIQHKH